MYTWLKAVCIATVGFELIVYIFGFYQQRVQNVQCIKKIKTKNRKRSHSLNSNRLVNLFIRLHFFFVFIFHSSNDKNEFLLNCLHFEWEEKRMFFRRKISENWLMENVRRIEKSFNCEYLQVSLRLHFQRTFFSSFFSWNYFFKSRL